MQYTLQTNSLKIHAQHKGKLGVHSKLPLTNMDDLSLAYSPGVAEPCRVIADNKNLAYTYTAKGNMVAVVSNGTAVLGLGDIGPDAALPVMEGKAILFKHFADIDAIPLCIDEKDPDRLISIIKTLEPTFGGINLEDIKAPECFIVENHLKEIMNIPVFHDDQHGTAIVTGAALINASKLAKKDLSTLRITVNGAGAAAIAVTKLLLNLGIKDIIMCDSIGIIHTNRQEGMNPYKNEIAHLTNPRNLSGSLVDALVDNDVFIGLSVADQVTADMVQSMAVNPIIFALANPDPEIRPEIAYEAGALVVGTGRSDYPNQINNILAFPGVFRGALDSRATQITEAMKLAAAYSIANLVDSSELKPDYILPNPFDPRVAATVAKAVAEKAREEKMNQI